MIRNYFRKVFLAKVYIVDFAIGLMSGGAFQLFLKYYYTFTPVGDRISFELIGLLLVGFSNPLLWIFTIFVIFYYVKNRNKESGEAKRNIFGIIIVGVLAFVAVSFLGTIVTFLSIFILGILGINIH